MRKQDDKATAGSKPSLRRDGAKAAPPDSEPAYSAQVQQAGDAFFIHDRAGRILDVNPKACEILGYTREELLARSVHDLDPDLAPTELQGLWDRTLRGEQSTIEDRLRRKDGRAIPVEVSLGPLRLDGGVFLLAIVGDITERKDSQETLRALIRRNEAMLQTIPDIIAEVDANKTYTWVNEAGRRFFGEEVVGKEASFYFEGDQSTYAMVEPLFKGSADVYYVESWQRRQDGQRRLLAWWCRSLKDDLGDVTGALSTARDITERRQVNTVTEARLRLLELAAGTTLEDFLRATLDELETLTNSRIGFCNFLEDNEDAITAAAWSTQTLQEYCKAEREGLHLRVSQAGVWADCIRQRRPVIHNDYGALHDRKGMPPGHGALVRELVVPVFRGDRIVAVLAVGNKPQDYTERDLQTVSSFADLAWDIAARKQAEAALQESDNRNRQLFDASPDAVFLSDATGHFLDCNQTAVDRYGYSRDEIQQMAHRDLAAGALQGRAGEHLKETLAHGGTAFEWRHRRRDGSELPVEIRTAPFATAQGQTRILATVRDLTESKLAEEALRRSEEEFRALFAAAPVGIGVADLQGKLLAFNDAMLAPGDYSREEVQKIDNVAALYYDPEERELALALFGVRGFLRQHDTRFKRKDGSPYDVWLSLTHTTFNGTPAVQAIVEDRTEKRRAEEALQQSEERFRSLASMTTEGIMIHEEGIIVDANRAFAELVGFRDPDDLIGKPGLEVLPATEESRRDILAHLRSRDAATFEIELVGPDGATLWAETRGQEVMYRGRPARLVFMRDITERRQAEEALRRSEEQLRQSQKMESVGRLAGGVAHDFNNMLGVILGHAELAMDQLDPQHPLFPNLLEIRDAAKRSASITQQLLAFARRQVAAPTLLDLNAAVEGMLDILRRLVGEDVDLEWLPGDDLDPVEIDPSQLDQVLVNLCANARDAISGSGRVTIRTATSVIDEYFCETHEGCVPGDYVTLAVSDTGCGMTEEALAHLFEPFFTTKEPGKGTGLGLATVYGIIKQNQGFIDVLSKPGLGTTFGIYLPRRTGKPAVEDRKAATQKSPGGDETLLLVEDEASVLRLTERILTGLNYRVLAARTPAEALRLAQTHPGDIHLLVTDVIMPEMNGWDLSRRLLALRPRLKTLLVSGYTDEVVSTRGVLDEGVHFLEKPFTPQTLAASVRTALSQE